MMRTVIRLWCHEACRTYYDRIVSVDDQSWFRNTLEEVIQTHFCGGPPKKHRPSPPPVPPVPEKMEETETSEDQESFTHPSSPPLPVSPTPTMNTATDEAEAPTEGARSTSEGDQAVFETSTPPLPFPHNDTPIDVNGEGPGGFDAESEISLASVSSLDVPLELKPDPASTPAPVPAIVTDLAPDTEASQSPKMFEPHPPPPRNKPLQPTPPSQPAVPPALKKEGEESKTRVGLKRGVTFKPGLIHTDANEEDVDVFKGPLIEMIQLKDPEEDLCAITFAKFVPGIGKEGNYVEYTESKLQAGLETCLAQYNATAQQKMELVFFTESIRHIARLTRVLASENANALLIGLTNGTGRSSLTHLASHMARCKLYTPQLTRDPFENRRRLRNQMKRASKTAGLIGRPAVLLVKEDIGPEAMEDVCCLIQEGTCPDLFTGEELEAFASQMLTGAKVVPGQRNQRLEMAQERFLRTIMKNLHVIVCMDCQNHSLASLTDRLRQYPILLNISHCVDSYLPWTQEGLARVAQHWLKVPTRDSYTDKRIRLPWPSHFQDRGVEALCQAMAYVHTTAAATTERLYVKPFKFFTPRNYLDFVDLFKNLTYKITKEERANVKKFEQALDKVNEAFSSISDYHGEIAALDPQYQMAKQRTEQILQEVHECEQIFADARGNCAEDEKEIVALQEPLNDMKKEAQAELDKVNPVYEAALHALRSLDKGALNELRTFHAPPNKVISVINAVCLMFRQPMDWTNGKVLINRKNFFQELEFYDKTAIPNDIFHKLNILFIQDPTFDPEVIKTASVAASSLCMWVHAVYAYAVIHRNMRPKLQSVEEAEAKVQEAQGHLGSKRVKAQDMKGLLEQKRKEYQESIRQVKLCEKKIQAIEAKIQAATDLMNNMEEQHQSWKSSLDLSHNHLKTAPGDSLLAAACTTYMGPMDETTRALVLADWLHACSHGRYQVGAGRASALSGMDHSLAASPALNAVKEVNTDATQGILPDNDSPSAEVELPGQLAVIDEGNDDGSHGSTSRRDQPESEISPVVPVRQNFNIEDILGDKEELINWRHSSSVVCDQFSVDNALYALACIIGRRRQWPLLIDPDNQALSWIVQLQEKGMASFHEIVYAEEEQEESLVQEGDLEEELNNPDLTEDRLMESRNLESVATSNFALSRADQSSLGGETDYGTEFPETPRTLTCTTNGGVTPKDNMSEKDFDIHSVGTSNHSVTTHPLSVDLDGARPFSDLWVVSADDFLLEERLIQSVVMGLSLVVTNLERKDLDVKFSDVLTRNVVENEEGEKSVRIGSHMYSYNTRFALYLTTTVPLELEGAGFLKPHTDQFSVIDMSVNQEGLTTRLLIDVMDAERPDFANHQHSIKADIRGHNKMLQETDLDILNKVIELQHGILEDAEWGETLNTHHQTIQDTTSNLKESCNLLDQLLEKQHPYQSVAEHGTLLYSTIKRIWQLLPTYYIPLRRFIRWYAKTLRAREKDRTDTASLKARAVELCNALTQEIHAHLSCGFFQHHSDLFVFLVAMERMRSSGEISEAEWDLLVSGLDGVVPRERETVFDEANDSTVIPEWLTNEIWIKCGQLEQLVPAFQGLRQSMLRHSSQWKEYFSCNPVLLAPVPGPDLQELSFCQKALLWRVVLPDRLAVICRHLVVYELGAHTARPEVYNAEEVLQRTSKNIPLVFVLPSGYHDGEQTGMEGHTVIDPLAEITLYCKQKDVRTVINTVSLGNEKQMSVAVDALQECVLHGHWLILNNCQAVDQWSKEFLQIIQHLVTPAANVEKTLPAKPVEKTKRDDSTTDVMSQTAPSQSSMYEGMEVHSNFKLIFITTADSKTPLPGLVIQNGMQVACQTNSNFKATLRTYFNQAMAAVDQHKHMVTTTQAKSLTELVFCMALLHTVLSHRRLFHQLGFNKDYSWGVSDLKAMMSCLNWCNKGESPWESIKTLRTLISHLVYGGHADILDDAEIIDSLIDSLLQPWASLKKMPSSMGAASLLASLVTEMSRGRRSGSSGSNMVARRFQHLFNTMQDDVEPAHLGLAPSAQKVQEERSSRYLSDALQALERCKPVHQTWYSQSLPKFLLSLEEELSCIPPLPPPAPESLNHLQNFISTEISIVSNVLERVQADVDLILKAVVGEAALTPYVSEVLTALSCNIIPCGWTLQKDCVPPSKILLPDWIKELRKRVETLQGYVDRGEEVAPYYRLDSFSHPGAFMDAVMLEHGRKEYLELHQLKMTIEVTGMEKCPAKAPEHGVYIWGLTLHNAHWDSKRSLIQLPNTSSSSHHSSPLPVVWLKPTAIENHKDTGSEKGSPLSTYPCPVHCGAVRTEELCRSEVVMKMDLPCTLDANMWKLKRVYATSSS